MSYYSLTRKIPYLFVIAAIFGLLVFGAAPVRAQARTYTVQVGDTLFSIADRFNVSVSELATINRIYDVNAIHVGQVLVLPNPLPSNYGTGGVAPTPQYGTGGPVSPNTGNTGGTVIVTSTYTTYVVQSGDTLATVAARFNTTPQAILATNSIPNPDLIYVGQVLVVQRSVTTTSPSRPVIRVVGGARVYIVQPGDTLFSIAARLRRDAWSIARANNILDLNAIYIGQALIIP